MGRQRDFKKHPRTRFAAIADLSRREAKAEVEALREGISFHDHKYYVENHPVIADAVYDRLFHRLRELEDAFPEWQSDNSPTRRVGGKPLDRLKRVRHTAPLLSLHAALDEGEFAEFHAFVRREAGRNRIRYVVEPKFDGVSVEVVYQGGRFQFGATRGDGRTGEDISANLRTIGSVPLSLRGNGGPPKLLAARGEVYLPRDGFQRMNRDRVERGDEPYANARNATAGILRRLESRVVGRIVHYGSREALDIDALGEQTARELVDQGLVRNLADLYELTDDDLLQLKRFAEKSAKKLHRAIQHTSRPRLDRFLYALGIRHVGSQVARVLARKFRSLDAVRRASAADLAGLKDVGPEIARSVRTFFDEPRNKDVLKRLERLGVAVRPMPSSETDKQTLSGKKFVFTGELKNYTRAAAKRAVERLGGRAASSVSGVTDYLVAGSNPGGKLDNARQRGVQVLDEKRFRKLLSR